MSDSRNGYAIAITPMHRTEEGIWETGPREDAQFLLVELISGEGENAEVVVECQDEHTAALAARIVASTLGALGLAAASSGEEDEDTGIEAFDEDTAAILAENQTPEIVPPSGEWRDPDEMKPSHDA